MEARDAQLTTDMPEYGLRVSIVSYVVPIFSELVDPLAQPDEDNRVQVFEHPHGEPLRVETWWMVLSEEPGRFISSSFSSCAEAFQWACAQGFVVKPETGWIPAHGGDDPSVSPMGRERL